MINNPKEDLIVYCPTLGTMFACIDLFKKYGVYLKNNWKLVFLESNNLCLRFDSRGKKIRFADKDYYESEGFYNIITYSNNLEEILKERVKTS